MIIIIFLHIELVFTGFTQVKPFFLCLICCNDCRTFVFSYCRGKGRIIALRASYQDIILPRDLNIITSLTPDKEIMTAEYCGKFGLLGTCEKLASDVAGY